jgi:hypothetical protein
VDGERILLTGVAVGGQVLSEMAFRERFGAEPIGLDR